MRDNWCDWCMVFRCAWAKVVELDLHQRCMLGTCLRMWPRKCPGSPYILCLCLPETSVCQRYSNVSSALMGKELKDPLTSFDLFETSDLHDLHVSAQIQNSWCWFLQLRPVEDIHIMTGRWQIHCGFIAYSIDPSSILSFCHFFFFFQLRKVEKWPSISIRQVLWSRRGTKLRDGLEAAETAETARSYPSYPSFKRFKAWRLRMR